MMMFKLILTNEHHHNLRIEVCLPYEEMSQINLKCKDTGCAILLTEKKVLLQSAQTDRLNKQTNKQTLNEGLI